MIARLKTDTGLVRSQNEDSSLVTDFGLYIVADGMGGHLAGEVASQMAVDILNEQLANVPASPRALSQAVQAANQSIYLEASKSQDTHGMGTTVTAVWVTDEQVLIGQVGDSRAYLFREGVLHRCTRDHSLVDDLVRTGMISKDQARTHPQRNVITRALGTGAKVSPDIFEWDRQAGDIWLICSDGLTDMVNDAVIANTLQTQPYDQASDSLLRLAMSGGGIDNITVLTLLDDSEVSA